MAVKRYDGSQWVTVAGKGDQGTSSSIATWVKTATGGETSVSGNDDNSQPLSYTVGQELVFINGALQKRGSDYTATTGNSITGLTALAANDVVTVWTVNAFSVTNAISNTLVDAKGDLIVATAADTPGILTAGTTGQVLTVDSTTGTGLKWATPSSGALVKISRQTFSNVASYTFDSVFSSTYSVYFIAFEDITAATQTDGLQLQLRYSGNTETGGYYGCAADFDYGVTGSLSGSQVGTSNASQFTVSRDLSASPDPKCTGFMYYIAPAATSKPSWHGQFLSGFLQTPTTFGGSQYSTSRAYDGILFKSASSNISGTISIYGVAQ